MPRERYDPPTRPNPQTSNQRHNAEIVLADGDEEIVLQDTPDDVDDFVDSYADEEEICDDNNEESSVDDATSDDGVYDLYAYTATSTPATYESPDPPQSIDAFNEDDFEYKLSLAIARYDAKPHRWTNYEQDDNPDTRGYESPGHELEKEITAEAVSSLPDCERSATSGRSSPWKEDE